MATYLIILLACVFACCNGVFNGRQSAFRQQMESIAKRPQGEDDQAAAARARWLKNYYQSNNFKRMPVGAPAYEMTSPDEFEWLTEEHGMPRETEEKSFQYPADSVKSQNLEELLGNLYDNGVLDYSDFYNIASLVNEQIPRDSTFQDSLRDYLIEQTRRAKIEPIKEPEPEKFQQDEQKKDASAEVKDEVPLSTTTVSTPVSQESIPKTTDIPIASTKPNDGLNILPPVHLGKGQKEYPMLRPASENGRKFDTWSEKFQKPMISAGLQSSLKDYNDDQASEDLNDLKKRSRRSAKLPPSFF